MKQKLLIGLLFMLPLGAMAGTPKSYNPTSALQFQQLSDTRMTMGDNVISFVTSDIERMTLDANGNLGIGTASPAYKLDVVGNGTSTTIAKISSGGHANFRQSRGNTTFDGGYLFYTGSTLDWRLQESANSSDLHIRDESLATNVMTFQDNTGNVGIGTTIPDMTLTVDGNVNIGETGNGQLKARHVNGKDNLSSGYGNLYLNYNTGYPVIVGKSDQPANLQVYGNIHGSTFTATTAPSWPDYVFEDSYKLSEIEEVEKYIEKNHHLPEIPSAEEVAENGVDIVSMQAKLLQKIEELTLYVIEQNKQNELQQEEISNLQSQISELKKKK